MSIVQVLKYKDTAHGYENNKTNILISILSPFLPIPHSAKKYNPNNYISPKDSNSTSPIDLHCSSQDASESSPTARSGAVLKVCHKHLKRAKQVGQTRAVVLYPKQINNNRVPDWAVKTKHKVPTKRLAVVIQKGSTGYQQ